MPRTLTDLETEMRAVASGKRKAPPARAKAAPASGIYGILTPANLSLIQAIAQHRPDSVSRLAELLERKQSNVSRSLQELAKWGIVRMVRDGQAIRPTLAATHIDVDLVANTYRLEEETAAAG